MRHDIHYRRVLRSHDYFLQKYKFWMITALGLYYLKRVFEEKHINKRNMTLKEELDKLKEKDLDQTHKEYYYTLFDKRLWIFTLDLINVSTILSFSSQNK